MKTIQLVIAICLLAISLPAYAASACFQQQAVYSGKINQLETLKSEKEQHGDMAAVKRLLTTIAELGMHRDRLRCTSTRQQQSSDNRPDCIRVPNGAVVCQDDSLGMNRDTVKQLVVSKLGYVQHLKQVEREKQMPDDGLVVMGIIESALGSFNGRNKHGYCGAFQFGSREWRRYGRQYSKSCTDRVASAYAAADLAVDYQYQSTGSFDTRNIHKLYHHHQQGPQGYAVLVAMINDQDVDYRTARRITHNVCNNIPRPYRDGLCVGGRRGYVLGEGYTNRDLAATYFSVYDTMINKYQGAVQETLQQMYIPERAVAQ